MSTLSTRITMSILSTTSNTSTLTSGAAKRITSNTARRNCPGLVWDGPRSEHPRCRHTRVSRNQAGQQPLKADGYALLPPTVNVRPRPRVAERLPRMRARHASAPLVAAFATSSQQTEVGLGGVTAPDRWWLQRLAVIEGAAAPRVSAGSEHSEASWSNQQAAGNLKCTGCCRHCRLLCAA
jgi:hypothetical protein